MIIWAVDRRKSFHLHDTRFIQSVVRRNPAGSDLLGDYVNDRFTTAGLIVSAIRRFLLQSDKETGIAEGDCSGRKNMRHYHLGHRFDYGDFGAAFGPLVLFALFSRKTSWQSALAGMVAGTVVLVLWKQIGLSDKMYEIVPGFAANCLTIILVNLLIGQKDESVLKEFDEVVNVIKS